MKAGAADKARRGSQACDIVIRWLLRGFVSFWNPRIGKHSAQTLRGTCFLISWLLRVSVSFWRSSVGNAVKAMGPCFLISCSSRDSAMGD